jgi:hypothetical protein
MLAELAMEANFTGVEFREELLREVRELPAIICGERPNRQIASRNKRGFPQSGS